jgi:hypothetical protein
VGVLRQRSDRIFHVLDGQNLEFEGRPCRVQIYGVYCDGDQRWVQLALADDRNQMLTLRIRAKDSPDCDLVSLATEHFPARFDS